MVLQFIVENLNAPQTRREFRKKYEGSPTYKYENDQISGNGFDLENFEGRTDIEVSKYVPLDLAIVQNSSGSNLEAQINQSSSRTVPISPDSTAVIEQDGIRSLKIVEQDGNQVDAGDVSVTVKKSAIDSDQKILQEKRNIFSVS